MRRFIYETLHPEIYHGHNKKPPYFEGWYYKIIDATEQHRYAVIPGIFISENTQDHHSFIQVLDGMSGAATYHQFPAEAFQAHEEKFDVTLGGNHFQADCLSLNIHDDQLSIQGELRFANQVPWPVTLASPGIMGWYGWIPFMECYHGVVSVDHAINGSLTVNGQTIDFTGGRGYIEKDWGQNFPSAYIWQQSNHFDTPGTSLMASVALTPFMNRTFPGFIIGLWHHGTLYRFTTYTGAQIDEIRLTDDHVYFTVHDKTHRLEMVSERKSGGLLKAPIRTEMHKRVDETMQSSVDVRFTKLDGTVLFEETGRNAALEAHGELDRMIAMLK